MVLVDLPLPSLGAESKAAWELMVTMKAMGLIQVIDGPTHDNGHIFD